MDRGAWWAVQSMSINKIAEEKLQVNVTRGASQSQPHARFSEIKEKMFLYSTTFKFKLLQIFKNLRKQKKVQKGYSPQGHGELDSI